MATFLHLVFLVNRVQQVSDLHPKFALRPHHVWKYGRHLRRLRLGEEMKKKKEQTTARKYNGLPYSVGQTIDIRHAITHCDSANNSYRCSYSDLCRSNGAPCQICTQKHMHTHAKTPRYVHTYEENQLYVELSLTVTSITLTYMLD